MAISKLIFFFQHSFRNSNFAVLHTVFFICVLIQLFPLWKETFMSLLDPSLLSQLDPHDCGSCPGL